MTKASISSVLILITAYLLFANSSCKRNDDTPCSINGVVKDLLGVDGCTVVVEHETTKELFEPVNLTDFGIAVFHGQKVKFSYQTTGQQGACLQGQSVQLLCFQER
jgi:hypothetical protein